jgi:F-box-like
MTQSLLRALMASVYDDINLLDVTPPRLTAEERLFQRMRKTALLVKLKSALSPIKELPHEILFTIFLYCISGTTKLPLLRSSTPWNLIHVCSKWREVALQVPNLWNVISVSFSFDRQPEFTRITNMLDAFLSRTGNALISLEIMAEHIKSSPHNSLDPFCKSIEDIVRPYAGRLRHLLIRPPDQFRALFGQQADAINVLESVSLHVAHFVDGVDATTAGIAIPGGTYNLRKVTVSTDSATLDLDTLLFPWAQLTELRILNTIVTYAGCHAALRQCPNLTSFTLSIVPDDLACRAEIPVTRLKNLTSLTVMGSADGRHGQFLRPFILPSLKEFVITGGPSAHWLGLPSLITRSSCTLERFEAVEFWTHEMLEFLRQVPSLIELSLRCSYSSFLLKEFIPNISLIPNLQILKCDVDNAEYCIALLEQRLSERPSQDIAVMAIRSWIIYGDPEKAREMVRKSARKIAQGMNIIFRALEA